MGRAGLVIKADDLKAQIIALEAKQTFENRSRLFNAICKTEWAQTIVDTLGRAKIPNAANIYQYVIKYKLENIIKTPQGKRGNPHIGERLTSSERKSRMEKRPGFLQTMAHLKFDIKNHFGSIPESKQKLLDKAAAGNKSACIKLKCLECSCWKASEAAQCTVYGCPLYLINPYVKSHGESPETDEVDE
jgi:hypothetical protein